MMCCADLRVVDVTKTFTPTVGRCGEQDLGGHLWWWCTRVSVALLHHCGCRQHSAPGMIVGCI